MRRWFKRLAVFFAMFFAVLGGMVACNSLPQPVQPPTPENLRIATYNVHYIWMGRETGDWSVGDWERRKNALQLSVRALDADVIGFQEMESFGRNMAPANLTLDYLRTNNPDYAAAAVGDPAAFPSTQPIFYRTDRLQLRDQGWFFFSDTPDVIYSRTFNGSWPAFASWAEFEDTSGTVFRVYNLHTEYRSASNRQLSAQLVADRIAGPAAQMPVFVIGDFNAVNGSTTLGILEDAGVTFWPAQGSTYHFNRGLNLFPAIDHIGGTEGIAPMGKTFSVRGKFDGEWPTDHYPIVGDFILR
ncbi:endonuclease/exonuclease/phosphatase family protein [Octadecabacter sp. 1_MG-2023]|uniref:endonuclease/exonuclease/phosphatase family protein n=1 Tax=unclassified Octadecabacter TaxID=196158 RepID=UPI001C0A0B8C|nr:MULTISPECIES: endonuclease/exonuclease/phosphatase family protein [unclassified Octadecabacter]MBU2994515.1 endonuclease/exonuclease/phosphatase family protein [Octadecabacter sp. B2R22]MDO6734192.1 endonuclease/exonuclease/phosphatase family protein [Octadecabacter sp. 1_MG-2023]